MASDEEVEAAKYFEMGAAQNHPGCLIHMGNYLISGSSNIPKDDVKAFSYYSRAAEVGSAEGWYKKGLCYQAGVGTNKNDVEAFNSFKKAQELGCKEMWFELGEYYRQGIGTPQNMQMALECYRHGADEENCHFCQRNLGYYYSGSVGDETAFNKELARKYLVPLADGGDQDFAPMAQFVLGLVAEKTGDTQEMIRRMEQAANNGVDNALMKLGFYYTLGDKGVAKNLGKARYYFTTAANKGISDASDMLSQIQQLERQQTSQPQYNQQTSSQTSQSSGSSGGCYVATCVYGSYDCPEVWTLRRYRDHTLAQTWYGRLFIKAYYFISPKAVSLFGKYNWFKHLWKGKLDQLVNKLQEDGFESTPYSDK